MEMFVLAAGEGTRLRPLTNERPKCLVEAGGKSLIDWQMEAIKGCGFQEQDVCIIGGYRAEALWEHFAGNGIRILMNEEYGTTNMVHSLMCARKQLERADDIIVSYGDIVYEKQVLSALLESKDDISVVVDDGWLGYWQQRGENPLDDAETLRLDGDGNLLEIGQKTTDIKNIEAQYIGLMRFRGKGIRALLETCDEAKRRSEEGKPLWRTSRDFRKMYMTDLLQGLIDTGHKLKAVHVQRGWFEVDCQGDLALVERAMGAAG